MWKVVGGIVINFFLSLIGKFIPSLAPPDPKQQAQAQKDRADNAEGLLKAKVEGDAIEEKVRADIAADPASLRAHDKFEIR